MAFDQTNTTHLVTLRDEVANDPIGMGYSSNTTLLLRQLTEGALNVGGETTGDDLTVNLLLDAIAADPGELTVGGQFSQGKLEFIKLVVESSLEAQENIERHRAAITNLFQPQDAIRMALEGQSRLLSRAEVLFGVDTEITKDNWYAARDYTG
jgi:hypothetical protein